MKTKFKFIKKLKNQKGFSLVELMVVVAIIGILAAIAIPNYQKFQRKSQQVEAKTMMSGLYANQITFLNEWNALSAAFDQIGFEAIGDSPKYTVGWVTGSQVATAIQPVGYRGPPALGSNSPINTGGGKVGTAAPGPSGCREKDFCKSSKLIEAFAANVAKVVTAGTCAGTCSTTTGTYTADNSDTTNCAVTCGAMTDGKLEAEFRQFVIGAAGDIGGETADLWYMDYQKVIKNVQSGL